MVAVIQVFNDLLQLGHERCGQMAVHEEAPTSARGSIIDEALCLFALTSSKRDGLKLLAHVHLLRKAHEIGDGIGSSTENEDQGDSDGRVLETLSKIECGRLNERPANLLNNEVLNSKSHLVGSQTLKDDHLLERVKLLIPFSWDGSVMRLLRVEDLLELLAILHEELIKALECRQLSHSVYLLVALSPLKIAKPVSRVLDDINCSSRSSKIVSPLIWIHELASEKNLDGEDVGEEQLVCLEQTSAHILVEVESEVVIEVFDSLFGIWVLSAVVYALTKEVGEPLQRVLIHGVDDGQINDREEEDGGSVCDGSVDLARLVDLLLGDLGLLHAHVDLIRGLL
jgi:hypothetical protein